MRSNQNPHSTGRTSPHKASTARPQAAPPQKLTVTPDTKPLCQNRRCRRPKTPEGTSQRKAALSWSNRRGTQHTIVHAISIPCSGNAMQPGPQAHRLQLGRRTSRRMCTYCLCGWPGGVTQGYTRAECPTSLQWCSTSAAKPKLSAGVFPSSA